MDGILVIDKPAGITSHDVVARIRRIAGQKRVGHAGTLDPAATGVLVILLGRATKLSALLTGSDKSYEGSIVFGCVTDTGDRDGRIVREADASSLTESAVKEAAKLFIGKMMQVPPMYSAIKVGGRPMYKIAREGKAQPEIEPRSVSIHDFEITSFTPGNRAEAGFKTACSKGTYIRSLAVDMGEAVGLGAYLRELRRTSSGSFAIGEAVSLDGLTTRDIGRLSRKMGDGLTGCSSYTVNEAGASRVMNGFGLTGTDLNAAQGASVAVFDEQGSLLAIHEATGHGGTKPVRVIGEGRL